LKILRARSDRLVRSRRQLSPAPNSEKLDVSTKSGSSRVNVDQEPD
jgi:hypothetical protein